MTTSFRTGFFILAGTLATLAAVAQTTVLKYSPKPGQAYKMTTATTVELSMDVNGSPTVTDFSMKFFSTQTVPKREAGNSILRVNYDRIVFKGDAMGIPFNYDSDKPGNESPADGVAVLVNKPFILTVAENGTVRRVEGLTELEQGSARDGLLKNMQRVMEQSLSIFPDRPVKPGDTWLRTSSFELSNLQLDCKNTYKLEGVSGGIARLSLRSEMQIGKDQTTESGLDMSMSGGQTGSFQVDVATGIVLESNISVHVAGEMMANGKKIPMKIGGKTQVSATKE